MVYFGAGDTKHLPAGVDVDPIPYPGFNMKRKGHDIMLLKVITLFHERKLLRFTKYTFAQLNILNSLSLKTQNEMYVVIS